MKRLLLTALFLVNLAGCTNKPKYDPENPETYKVVLWPNCLKGRTLFSASRECENDGYDWIIVRGDKQTLQSVENRPNGLVWIYANGDDCRVSDTDAHFNIFDNVKWGEEQPKDRTVVKPSEK